MKTLLTLLVLLTLNQLEIFAQKEYKYDTLNIKTSAQCEMCKQKIRGSAYSKIQNQKRAQKKPLSEA